MPGCSGEPRGDYARVLCFFRTRGCGCNGHPAFPTPSVVRGGGFLGTTRARRVAGKRGCVCLDVIARSGATKQSTLASCGPHGLLRFARNDDSGNVARLRCLKIWIGARCRSSSIDDTRCCLSVPSPLWGRGREGGGRIGTARVNPSPQPSPTRGAGVH